MVYFKNVNSIQELKKQYKNLVKLYHPDLNATDTTKIMQEINAEYDTLFTKVKNSFTNAKGEIYEKQNEETLDEFKNIINTIITFKDCRIEIIGSWIWVSGNTKYYKDILKSLNFKWIQNKKAWAYHKERFFKTTNKVYTLEELRKSFISVDIKTKEVKELAEGL